MWHRHGLTLILATMAGIGYAACSGSGNRRADSDAGSGGTPSTGGKPTSAGGTTSTGGVLALGGAVGGGGLVDAGGIGTAGAGGTSGTGRADGDASSGGATSTGGKPSSAGGATSTGGVAALGGTVGGGGISTAGTGGTVGLQDLTAAWPGVRALQDACHVSMLFGAPMGSGSTAAESTDAFIKKYSQVFGVAPEDLRAISPSSNILYNPITNTHGFLLSRFEQYRSGIRVYGARLAVLVRNSTDYSYPVMLVASTAQNLRDYVPTLNGETVVDAATVATPADVLARLNVSSTLLAGDAGIDLTEISDEEFVIWTGQAGKCDAPRMAVSFAASTPTTAPQQAMWHFVIDAQSGDTLVRENLIDSLVVLGSVQGYGTPSALHDCATNNSDTLLALPYAKVTSGNGIFDFANGSGSFSVEASTVSDVSGQFPVSGQFFVVSDLAGSANDIVSLPSTSSPNSVSLIYNSSKQEEQRAQVNAYRYANVVRAWVLANEPEYPGITEADALASAIAVDVPPTDSYCSQYAAWHSSDGSLNFCRSGIATAGGKLANTAIPSVVCHEYGHQVVQWGARWLPRNGRQGAYGEGMADALAALTLNDPQLGTGIFASNCAQPLRNADNSCQYDPTNCSKNCGSDEHDCGQLLSGTIWSLKNELQSGTVSVNPAALVLSSIGPYLDGPAIRPSLSVIFLTLDAIDGRNGFIEDGAPDGEGICRAFSKHGLLEPTATPGCCKKPRRWNESAEQCECPSGQTWNPNAQPPECEMADSGTNDSGADGGNCASGWFWSDTDQRCYEVYVGTTTFYTGGCSGDVCVGPVSTTAPVIFIVDEQGKVNLPSSSSSSGIHSTVSSQQSGANFTITNVTQIPALQFTDTEIYSGTVDGDTITGQLQSTSGEPGSIVTQSGAFVAVRTYGAADGGL